MSQNYLTPKDSGIDIKQISAFDIETKGPKNEFVMGSIVGDQTIGGKPEVYHDKIELLDALLSRRFTNGHIYATNIQFDLMGIIDTEWLIDNGFNWEIFHNGANVIYAQFSKDKRTWDFRDTLNVAPRFSVESMGEIIDLPKLDMDFDGKGIESYDMDYVEKYNIRDSKISYEFIKWFRSEINSLGGSLEITAAKTSMDFFRRNYLQNPIQQPTRDVVDKSYEGYYGGRVSPFTKGQIDGPIYCYDIASLYPYCLTVADFPDTNTIRYTNNDAKVSRIMDKEGMSLVDYKAPDMHKPILPYRTDDKLLFPTGGVESVWIPHNELRFAIDRGYVVDNVREQIYTQKSFNPFEDFIDDLYSKRMDYRDSDNDTEIVVKLLMNSFYGKLGQRIENPDAGLYEPIENYDIDNLDGKRVLDNGWVVDKMDDSEDDYFPSYINPILAAYVTSRGRMELYKWFERVEQKGGEVYYCDTDSIYTDTKLNISDEKVLGGMDFEAKYDKGWVFGPKFYIMQKGDTYHKTAKGVPYDTMDKMWQAIQNGKDKIHYDKIAKMRESLKRGIGYNMVIDTERSINIDKSTKRRHTSDKDIRHNRIETKPYTLDEIGVEKKADKRVNSSPL